MLQDFELKQLVEPLLEWFSKNARELPWREEPTPYRVWVSEIMLQQTRVEAVKPYFERFMKRLPDVKQLAECPEDELLKLWEGLGYYNRVRNMQKAAQQIMEDYDGVIPSEYEELLKLKGIGNYTAGAISSIAYGKAAAAVDGNVFRILTRVSLDTTDIMKPAFRKVVEQEVMKIIPTGQEEEKNENLPGKFNQALMELGATVCLPNGMPLCGECPWKQMCRAHIEGKISELPVKSKAKPRKIEKRTVLIIRDGEKIAIRKRPAKGLLAGLYELPNLLGELSQEEALQKVKEMDLSPIRIQKLEEAKHIFSHIEWQMTGYMIRVEELEEEKEGLIFVEAENSQEKYAIPSAFAAYVKYMNIKLGNERFEE
ncbi:MAG: A/G-specific adenine glycosylase [Roseburia sp.]